MNLLCLISLVLSASLWFFAVEYDRLFGVYYPTCAIRRRNFNLIVLSLILLSISMSSKCGVSDTVGRFVDNAGIDCVAVMVILLASFITLATLKFFSVRGSVSYALLGSLASCIVYSGGAGPQWHLLLPFVLAPGAAYLLAWGLRSVEKLIFTRVQVHLVTLSSYMRYAIVSAVVLTGVALGFNWGGFIIGLGSALEPESAVLFAALPVTIVLILISEALKKRFLVESSGIFADFSVYAVVSVGFSVALTLLFFSFEATTSLVNLHAVPLSVSSLVMAAVAGTEAAQKYPLVEKDEYINESVAFVAAPAGSFLLTYVLMSLINADAQNQLDDFAVMAAAIAVLMALGFAGYVRRQRLQREVTDKLVYTQQQQIYEHSRALNDMELKVVLSENQALHNAVEMKRQEVMNVALSIVEQRDYLESLNKMVVTLTKTDDIQEKERIIAELRSSLQQRLSYDRDVDSQYFYAQAESLHEDFNAKLSENFPNMTQQERRLATLLRLGFSSKYIATLMNITPKSVEISRYRLRQKLGLSKGDNLVNYIKSL